MRISGYNSDGDTKVLRRRRCLEEVCRGGGLRTCKECVEEVEVCVEEVCREGVDEVFRGGAEELFRGGVEEVLRNSVKNK